MLYNFTMHLSEPEEKNDIMEHLEEDIARYKAEGDYFRMFKRMFSKSVIEGHPNHELFELMNSDYGLMYKTINSLCLVVLMIHQNFTPLKI